MQIINIKGILNKEKWETNTCVSLQLKSKGLQICIWNDAAIATGFRRTSD